MVSLEPSMKPKAAFVSVLLFLLLCCAAASGCRDDLISCLASHRLRNVTIPSSASYLPLLDSSLTNLRFAKPVVRKPVAIVVPQNKLDLANVIRCATRTSTTIRLRSGGHNAEGTSSVADKPFVLVDLMKLNRVKVDIGSETAWVEAGATLGEVYYAIATSSKVHGFTAGMCPTVGSGGHFSGGGFGALMRKYGLAVDNIVDALLVDARGRVLDRKAMGEEVFWAIRGGGGGNFGAVLAWKIRLHRVPEKVATFKVMRMGTPAAMAELWYKWQLSAPKLEDEFFTQTFVIPGFDPRNPIMMAFMGMYLGSRDAALASINRAFPELGVTAKDYQDLSWAEALMYMQGNPKVQKVADLLDRSSLQKTFTKAKGDYVRVPIPKAALQGALELVAKQPKAFVTLTPYGGAMDRIRSDSTPFPHRAGNLYSIEYYANWAEADDVNSASYIDWVRNLYDFMTPYVAKDPRATYVNNMDFDLGTIDWRNCSMTGAEAVEKARPWGEKYYMGNYDRLVRVKAMIDPYNVFHHPQSVPPLTSVRLC